MLLNLVQRLLHFPGKKASQAVESVTFLYVICISVTSNLG